MVCGCVLEVPKLVNPHHTCASVTKVVLFLFSKTSGGILCRLLIAHALLYNDVITSAIYETDTRFDLDQP